MARMGIRGRNARGDPVIAALWAALGLGWAAAHPAVLLITLGCCAAAAVFILVMRWDARREERRDSRDVPVPASLRYRYGALGDNGPAPFEKELALPPWAQQPTDVPGREVREQATAQATLPALPAGDQGPGPGRLPEGDTQQLWPPQEAPGPGDLLAKATAAIGAVQAIPVSDYLTEVEAATTWEDRAPLASLLSQDTITRGLPPIKDGA
jgi:hypothetical protein